MYFSALKTMRIFSEDLKVSFDAISGDLNRIYTNKTHRSGLKNILSRNGRKCHKTLVVRDTENIVTTFKVNQSVTATAILGEENLHPNLPPLQRKYATQTKPTEVG